MSDTRISQLTAGTPSGTAAFPYSEGIGTTLSVTYNQLNPFNIMLPIVTPGTAVLHPAVECGFSGTIESVRLYSGTTLGDGTIDIYKMTYAQLGTGTVGTSFSIIGTATKPAIAGTNIYQGTTFTGWTSTTFSKGDWLIPYVVTSGTITALQIAIGGRKLAIS